MTRMTSARHVPAWVCAVIAAAMAAGCLEVETPLGPVEKAVADSRLVGDWRGGEGDSTIDIVVRNFNGRELYAEARESGKEPSRYAVFLVDVGGASFAHLRELKEDGTLPGKYLLMRLDRDGEDKLNLRNLKEDFFEDKPHDTAEKLRAAIAANLENPAMYEDGAIRLARVKKSE